MPELVELVEARPVRPPACPVVVPSPPAPVEAPHFVSSVTMLGGTYDLLYAILAAALGLRPALQAMDIYRGIVAAEPCLKRLSPAQLPLDARVHLGGGRIVYVSGVEDSLTFLELYRGLHRRVGVCAAPARRDVEDLLDDWLCPFIGGKIERVPQLRVALREQLWGHIALAADTSVAWGACAQALTGRFELPAMFLEDGR